MGKKVVESVEFYDDWDGTPLEEKDAKPRYLTFEGVRYEYYLTNEHQHELADIIKKLTSGTAVPPESSRKASKTTRSTSLNTYGLDAKEVREVGLSEGITKPQGRLSQAAYDHANKVLNKK
jgi:hypothetical protein